ncbi:hypothetical protein HNP73_003371 [Amaricoccus macauensis]|uniref:Uncharacterized protein n=1 Tax=Amaricoccus macauensis TaxID=57001 RepID=A0A840SQR3_9RHOB|nr:hypothetical protein [Amaricoccus macauensis]MBB5223424.1 hypothetical protein [Amaricoccus macauensis]
MTGIGFVRTLPRSQLDEITRLEIIDRMLTTVTACRAAFALIAGGEAQ